MSDDLRHWQQPLSEEKIAMLQEQFDAAQRKIEAIWGQRVKPWASNRRDD